MSKKSDIILVSFLLMLGAALGLNRLLSGGTDAQIVTRALQKFAAIRQFTGTVSIATTVPKGATAGEQQVVYVAKGRFAVPKGKSLVGAWTVSVGTLDNANAMADVADMAVTEDGTLYLRAGSNPALLGLPAVWHLPAGKWASVSAAALLPKQSLPQNAFDAAAVWNDALDTIFKGQAAEVAGRGVSETVVGEPCWHFFLSVPPAGAARLIEDYDRLRLGRDLSTDEIKADADAAIAAAPKAELWVAKSTGEMHQLIVNFVSGASSPESGVVATPVILSFQFAGFPAYEPVTAPAGAIPILTDTGRPTTH